MCENSFEGQTGFPSKLRYSNRYSREESSKFCNPGFHVRPLKATASLNRGPPFPQVGGPVYSSRMAVTMKDIARELGVSLVTVSKALRQHPDISKQTRERVEAKVRELDYRPNLAARSLATGRSFLVGFVVPDLIHPFFAEIAKGLSLTLRESGYFLVMSSSEEDPNVERQEISHMLAHRPDAVVVASCAFDSSTLLDISKSETPLILLDRFFDHFPAHFVGSDDYKIGKIAVEHLIARGCKRIAHVRGPEHSTGRRRLKAFTDTLAKHNIPLPPEYVFEARSADVDGKQHGARAIEELSRLKRPPDGIWCYNDVVANGVIMQALRQGIRVPEDLAVIGCGDLHYDESLRVPLSSIDQRSREIGSRAAKLILSLIEEEAKGDPRRIILEPKLVARESTARPAKGKSARNAK